MSECVVRMEMPKRCGTCKCRRIEFDIDCAGVFCSLKSNKYVEDPDSRPSWCPIVCQLPDNHGDLIDRNDYIKKWKETKKKRLFINGLDVAWLAHVTIPAKRSEE